MIKYKSALIIESSIFNILLKTNKCKYIVIKKLIIAYNIVE